MRLTTQLLLLPSLRMCGAIPPLPQYAFMMFIGTTLPFYSDNGKSIVHLRTGHEGPEGMRGIAVLFP